MCVCYMRIMYIILLINIHTIVDSSLACTNLNVILNPKHEVETEYKMNIAYIFVKYSKCVKFKIVIYIYKSTGGIYPP